MVCSVDLVISGQVSILNRLCCHRRLSHQTSAVATQGRLALLSPQTVTFSLMRIVEQVGLHIAMRLLPKSLAFENYVKGLSFMRHTVTAGQPFTEAMLEHAWPYISAEQPLDPAAIWPQKLPLAAVLAAIKAGICQVSTAEPKTLKRWLIMQWSVGVAHAVSMRTCLAAVRTDRCGAGPGLVCRPFGQAHCCKRWSAMQHALPSWPRLACCRLTNAVVSMFALLCDVTA